ncbi:hypothetical protein LBMAG42_19380 [Deltaproteobacteria bacterium]|nr:hypothetical protein LBMAG42_19380 [Deltaproteobacteria bacterium]
MRQTALFFPFVLLAACSSGLTEATFPTGSQTVITSSNLGSLYVVDEDGGSVSRVSVESGESVSYPVGVQPERVARAKDKVFVTIRGERSLAIFTESGTGLTLDQKFEVGAEPVGVVAREDGKRIFVALSQDNAVVEIDGSTLAEVRRWSVEGHPSWLALHPSNKALFVASAMGGGLTRVDLESGTAEAVALPEPVGAGASGQDTFSRRLTGDLWISADGSRLAVPGLYVDNLTPADDPAGSGVEVSGGGYASSGSSTIVTSRFNPGVTVAELDTTGVVTGTARTVFLAGDSPIKHGGEIVRSYPTSVSMPPRGDVMVVTMEASSTAIVVSMETLATTADDSSTDTGGSSGPLSQGFSTAATVFTSMNAGPHGAAFLDDDTAMVDNFLDHSLRSLDVGEGRRRVNVLLAGTSSELSMKMEGGNVFEGVTPELDADVEAGRKLFFSAVSSKMASDGAGVSCSTCHFEGRNDGLTWTFTDSVRQTPSLAASVAETAPYTWTAGVDTIAAEAIVTSQGRMGGSDLTAQDALDIQAFIQNIPEVDVALRGSTDASVVRGQALFESADVGCADCHPAPLYTDNDNHDIYGLSGVNTPSLVGIASSAPYLHNGSAGTLRDVLESALTGAMGSTGGLSEAEKDDLEAFLLSL